MSEPTTSEPEVAGKLIAAYLQIREALAVDDERHKAKQEPLKERMQLIEGRLQQMLIDANVNNMAASAGTAYLREVKSATVKDRGAFLTWITTSQNWDAMDVKANAPTIAEYVDKHGKVPPGVNFSKTKLVRINAK